MSANTALELEDVVFRYQEKGKRNILDHASLSIPAGTLTVLMGGSGCGKSTLAAVAAGLYPENGGFLEGGTIRLYGQDLKTLDPQKRAAYLTVLFQNPDLQFCMNTLREDMRFCLENIRVPDGEMDARIDRAAAELGIAPLLDRTLSTLSGGEKQKAALSCLYVMESRCILLDESFANLDHEAAAQLLEMLLRMKTSGRTILAIDHKADLWLEAADEIILLEEGGKVAARGINCKNLPEHRADFERLGLFYPGSRPERAARPVAEALFPARPARRDDFYSELCTKRSRGRARVWALWQGETLACTVGAYALANGQAYMACGETAEPLRGRGIGGRLIVRLANELSAEGFQPVFLCAPERVHFYTRLGFEKLGEYARYEAPAK